MAMLLPLPLRERLAEARARAALELLHRAAKAGFFRASATVARMSRDPHLDFLRGRAEFKAFVATLTAAGAKGP